MPLQRLEHYLVLTENVEKTKDFYCDVLGMSVGFRPELDFAGFWVYLGDTPCIHIGDRDEYAVWTKRVGIPISTEAEGTGPLDHIAFNATGFEDMRRRLVDLGIPMSENSLDDVGLKQIFLCDPNGVAIELNFRS